jgi:endo-1,4-beta-xylanase
MKSLVAVLLAAAAAQAQTSPTLKDAFKGMFRIGAALNLSQFEERDSRGDPIIAAQFNTTTPENVLKWEIVHPRADAYNFEPGDK